MFKCIRRGGAICEVGHFVDGGDYNSFEYPNAYHFLQRAEGIGIPVTRLITHRFPLSRIEDAFGVALRQEGIRVVVESSSATQS